jgi:ribonuclease BN (tRNA processing enzyme)
VDFCSGADVLFHDAEFTEVEYEKTKGWGHSTWNQALELALKAGVKKFGLFHHNHDRDDAGVDGMVAECRGAAAGSRLECFGVTQETVLEL